MNPFHWHFNFYYSIPFWLFALPIALASRLFGRSPTGRQIFLGTASALMVLAIPGFGLTSLGLVIALSLVTYGVGAALTNAGPDVSALRRQAIAGTGIMAVLGFLAFFKYGFVRGGLLALANAAGAAPDGMIRMIGVSYFSFRMIHFLVEAYKRKVKDLGLWTYLGYIIFFPAFISGPINRYNPFAVQLSSPLATRLGPDLRAGGERIVHGLFKKFVLAQILYPHILSTRPETLSAIGPVGAILGLYAYALYFYFDFAGYSDLAIGCSRLAGIELPENFNNPFLKRNIRELWTNWHMSLTSWLVDYIYWPIVRKFRGLEYFRRHPVFLSNLGMIITFILCGMWHGETLNFVLWGAYHGIGIAVLTVYQREKRKVRSARLQAYFRSKASAIFGTVLTFHFFAFGLSLFVLDSERLRLMMAALIARL